MAARVRAVRPEEKILARRAVSIAQALRLWVSVSNIRAPLGQHQLLNFVHHFLKWIATDAVMTLILQEDVFVSQHVPNEASTPHLAGAFARESAMFHQLHKIV